MEANSAIGICIGITLFCLVIAIVTLIIIFFVFDKVSKMFNIDFKKRILIKKGKIAEAENLPQSTTVEINAAIAMTLFLYTSEMHDIESTKLTINKVSKIYSPWSSKIYGLRQDPHKK